MKWIQRVEAEANTSLSQSRHKKGHITNICLTDSDEDSIVDFVSYHEELYNKKFKDKARKVCLWERFASSHNLSVKVCKTWFKSQRTPYGKTHPVQVWPGSQGNDRKAEPDSGQISLFEDPHQKEEPQQIFRP